MEPLYLPFILCQLAFCLVIYLSVHILLVIIRLAIFFFIFISTLLFRSSFVRSPDCLFAATKSFTCPLNVLYLFLHVLLRLSATRVLLSARLRFLQFPFSRGTTRVNTFSSSLSRVIDQRGELRAASGEICRLGERNYDVHGDNPFSPQLLTGNF